MLPHHETHRPMKRSLPLLLLLAFSITGASAQTHRVIQANDRLIAEALLGMGVSPDSPAVAAAVPRAFGELYPRERYDRHRLSAIQARAVAYTAVIIATEYVPATQPVPVGPRCVDLVAAAYELAGEIPAGGGLFLSGLEKSIVRRDAADIRRLAAACGCFAVADKALELTALASESMPSRSTVIQTITELRRLAARCD
jgi:Arc/MetJ family transcription regulator